MNEASDKLEAGDLHVSELSDLTDVSRELYERLITLRYAAMEKEVKQDTQPEKKESFRLNPTIHPGQTSLIDAIEEVEVVAEQEQVQQEQESIDQEEEEEVVLEEEEEAVSIEQEEEEAGTQQEEEQETLFSSEESAPAEAESLAEKLSRTPIADLRQAIGLNTKFQLIQVYFEGDAAKYDEVIDAINGAPSLENAMETFTASTDSFGDEDHVALEEQLIDLIERRFL